MIPGEFRMFTWNRPSAPVVAAHGPAFNTMQALAAGWPFARSTRPLTAVSFACGGREATGGKPDGEGDGDGLGDGVGCGVGATVG